MIKLPTAHYLRPADSNKNPPNLFVGSRQLTTTPTSDESTIVEKEPSPAWRLLSASEQAGIESLNPQVSFEEWKEVERAVLTTTGEEVIILDFFENNGILIAIIEYLSDGSQGTSDLDFLRPSPQ